MFVYLAMYGCDDLVVHISLQVCVEEFGGILFNCEVYVWMIIVDNCEEMIWLVNLSACDYIIDETLVELGFHWCDFFFF